MENNIKKIKDKLIYILIFVPFVFGVYYGIAHMSGLLNIFGTMLLGMAGTSIISGIVGEARLNYGSGIGIAIGIFIGLIGGLMFLINHLIK